MSEEMEVRPFEFDDDFQMKIAALTLRDATFMERTAGLVEPAYFEDAANGMLSALATEYFQKYRSIPSVTAMKELIKDAKASKRIRPELLPHVIERYKQINKADVSDRDFVIDKVEEFARHQAMEIAILKSAESLDKRDFATIDKLIQQAQMVGASAANSGVDYFATAHERAAVRKKFASGEETYNSITSGIARFDSLLYQKGWGRKELTVLMGKPKVGKSTSLVYFGRNAALAGYNVLLVSLEVSSAIVADRLDAAMTETAMTELIEKGDDIAEKIDSMASKAGLFEIHEFPTGTYSPADLKRLVKKRRAEGVIFDMIVVDYADIMAPSFRSGDPIADSKSIYVELRALAQEENAALLTATQTNREGAKASVSSMEHVAEDFNRVRIADILISINIDETERRNSEARLYFAASRNQRGDFTVKIKQDVERMQFIERILAVE